MKRYLFLMLMLSYAFSGAADRQLIINSAVNLRNLLGSRAIVNLPRESGTSEGCFIVKPDGSRLPISATQQYTGVSWYFRPNSVFTCSVELGPLDSTMFGKWTLVGWFNNNGELFEAQQPANIAQEGGDVTLAPLEYLTNIGATIDISLNETGEIGTCGLSTPDGVYHALDETFEVSGVTINDSDTFVKCRVTIGPMSSELLGGWTLMFLKTDQTHITQRVSINWADPSNPEAEAWEIATEIPNTFVSLFGSFVEIAVGRTDRGGLFKGCSITTPEGVTLPAYYRYYPRIAFTLANRVSACIITLGPLDDIMFGRWTLSADYEVDGFLVEKRQPVTIIRHDGVTRLPVMRHFTTVGAFVDINIDQNGNSGTCRIRSPAGIEYALTTGSPVIGVTAQSSSSYVSCRALIGPMTAGLLGEWTLIQQSADQTQRTQPVNIAWADPTNPMQQARQLIIPAPQSMSTDLGGIVPIGVSRQDGFFEGCFLTIPDGATIPIFETSQYLGVTYDGSNRLNGCFVEIGPVEESMLGTWILKAHYNDHGTRSESQQTMNIIEDDLVTTFPILRHYTHTNEFVDISLNQTSVSGSCFLRSPIGVEHALDSDLELDGITIKGSSKFVSCRVLIGPLTDSLLGDWILIQKVDGHRERRQPASIQWANPLNPTQPSAQVVTAAEQSSVVSFGSSENVYVAWQSEVLDSCWIITPNEEVLPVSPDKSYPGINWSRANSAWACTATLGPIDDEMVGRWLLIGIFENDGVWVASQQPLSLSRNTDIETAQPLLQFWTNIGGTFDLSLSNTNEAFDVCRLITPSGVVHDLDESFEMNGVTVHKSSNFVSCFVTIGPMTEELIGEWTLMQEQGNQWHRRQTVMISWANRENPSQEVWHFTRTQTQESVVNLGESIEVFVSRDDGFFEGCYITTPDGAVLPIFPTNSYPGITHIGENRVTACFVEIGPVSADLVGRWTLSGRFNNAGNRIESQVPIVITLGDGITRLPLINYLTHAGQFVDLSLNNTGSNGACTMTAPTGQEYSLALNIDLSTVRVIPKDEYVNCAIRIGPITEAALGQWTLTEQNADQTQRIQSVLVAWANPQSPSLDSREIIPVEDQLFFARLGSVVALNMQRRDGLFEGCFITTPQGVNLPIFPENQYTGIMHVGQNRLSACFIQLGPIEDYMHGTWTLVGRFLHYDDGMRAEYRQQVHIEFSRKGPFIAWIITVCVVLSLVAAIGGVMSFRRSRVWTQNKFDTFRNSFKSTASRAELSMNEYSPPENEFVTQAHNPAVLHVNHQEPAVTPNYDTPNFDPLGIRRVQISTE